MIGVVVGVPPQGGGGRGGGAAAAAAAIAAASSRGVPRDAQPRRRGLVDLSRDVGEDLAADGVAVGLELGGLVGLREK